MNKLFVFFVFLTSLHVTSNASAQEQQVIVKKHYNLYSSDVNDDLTLFDQAIKNYSDLDQFRFLNDRRTIKFSGTNVSIELFSANELFAQSGKLIAPLTILPGSMYRPVEFMITSNDDILTVFPLYIKQDPIQY